MDIFATTVDAAWTGQVIVEQVGDAHFAHVGGGDRVDQLHELGRRHDEPGGQHLRRLIHRQLGGTLRSQQNIHLGHGPQEAMRAQSHKTT